VCVFIEVSIYMCMSIYAYNVFLKKDLILSVNVDYACNQSLELMTIVTHMTLFVTLSFS
jgi:hypothetical protein